MKKSVFLIAVLILIYNVSFSQTYIMNNNTAVNLTCPSTSTFVDSGNSGAAYLNNENYTKTFNAPAGSCLQVSFTTFNTEACCDRLRIYDGPSGASPLIGTYVGVGSPGVIVSSGTSLTFSFTSDGSITNPGWTATITCLNACAGMPTPGVATMTTVPCGVGGTATLTTSGGTAGCGISLLWQWAPSLAGPWSTLSGGGNNTVNTTYTATTFYRQRIVCGGNIAYSNTLSVVSSSATCPLSSYGAVAAAYSFDVFVGTTCAATDDVLYNNIAMMGFPFCYTGSQYWGGYIASNGAFVFPGLPCYPNIQTVTYAAPGVGTGWSIPSPAPINNTSIPRNAILGPWHDIDPSLGGTIRYATLGVAPNRRFVVSFENIPMFSCGIAGGAGQYFSGQIKLFETTNDIEIHVRNKQLCTTWNSGRAVMGLHSFDGAAYVPPVNAVAHNSPTQWTMTNTAYRFSAACASAASGCVVLPIHFKSFYGERTIGINNLYWETSEEENIKTFMVERSIDGENFKEIGKVVPNNKPSKYHFEDKATMPGTLYYYRVASFENNGARNYTTIYPLGANIGEIAVSGIFPNPVKGDFTLTVDSKIVTAITINIYDAIGKLIKSYSQNVGTGASQLNLYCGELPAGIYILETTNTNKEVVAKQKMIKVD